MRVAACLVLLLVAQAVAAQGMSAERRSELVRMVRQDCGACHGMWLTGGLGPALTRQALADKPTSSLASAIFQGRPGTPMPGWRAMISLDEAQWIAEQLTAGFPAERKDAR